MTEMRQNKDRDETEHGQRGGRTMTERSLNDNRVEAEEEEGKQRQIRQQGVTQITMERMKKDNIQLSLVLK